MYPNTAPSTVAAAKVGAVLIRFNTNAHALVQILRERQGLQVWRSRDARTKSPRRSVGCCRVLFNDNVTDPMFVLPD